MSKRVWYDPEHEIKATRPYQNRCKREAHGYLARLLADHTRVQRKRQQSRQPQGKPRG